MQVRRRGVFLSAAFAALALWLCPGPRAQAQFQPQFQPQPAQPGRHNLWQQQVSPDQVRQLLGQFGQGDSDTDRLLKDLIRDRVTQTNPGADPKQVEAAIDRLLKDKAFRDRITDLAQKNKNINPNPGNNLQLTPQDIERLKNLRPNGNGGNGPNGGNPVNPGGQNPRPGGDPFKLPPPDPKDLPPFDPDTFDPRNFDPNKFPAADPRNPPKIDPDSRLPIDPKTDRPFDPRTGQPLDPRTGRPPEPKVDPKDPDPGVRPDPKVDPPPKLPPNDPRNPAVEPKAEPKEEPDPNKFDKENPLGKPKESPQSKVAETATALWEKNVGPIDESPAVKRAIFDLVNDPETMDALTDGKGNNLFDMFKDMNGGDGFGKDLFGSGGGGWEWPKLDLKLNLGNSNRTPPDLSGSGEGFKRPRWFGGGSSGSKSGSSGGGLGGLGSFSMGGMQVPWLVFLILALLVVAAVVWWKWDQIAQAVGRRPLPPPDGLGPWPVDPRNISSREDVVKAFEYLSVLICGIGAKTWTHSTVADELTHLARTNGPAAVKLARLYELARYAPLDEPLTRAELVEARRLVCDLAELD